MLAVIVCLVGVLVILAVSEYLGQLKLIKSETQRKLAHIGVAAFVAFWPWLISWHTIEYIGLAMLAVVIIDRAEFSNYFSFNKNINRNSYGDVFFALAIVACALLTQQKIFFALAMLNLSLADGLAALIGLNYGRRWKYKIYHHTKTVIGSMAFWIVAACILGTGLLFAHDLIDFNHYVILVVAVPPILTMLENVAIMGLDDLIVPAATVIVLQLARMH